MRICLDRDLPVNEPYSTDNREYRRDAVTPLLDGSRGFLYKTTAEVNTWLFTVNPAGAPTLRLTLDGLTDPNSVSVNGVLISSTVYAEVPVTEEVTLRVANSRIRATIRLLFTNLPILELRPQGTVYEGRSTPCALTVADPDYRVHGMRAANTDYEAAVSRRGRSSARYANKHPYNVSLLKDGRKWDHSLLGLRVDSDWILDSAYSDASRMRNRVLMDVWDELYRLPWDRTRSGAVKGVFVELFVNGAYRGLYVFSEKQDRTQLGLSDTDGPWNSLFLRTTQTGMDGSSPAGFLSLGRSKPGRGDDPFLWYNVEIKYPKADPAAAAAQWADFYDFVHLVVKGSPEEFAARITQYADLDNLALYWLFVNAADINDNMRKNMSFVRLDDRDGRFNRFLLLPWDMDSALGRYYTSKKSRTEEIFSNRLFNRLFRENPEDFTGIVRRLWARLRDTALSADRIMARFDGYYGVISLCGADSREMKKHPKFTSYVKGGFGFELNFQTELAYIRRYLDKHLAWLDRQIETGNWSGKAETK